MIFFRFFFFGRLFFPLISVPIPVFFERFCDSSLAARLSTSGSGGDGAASGNK
jgi:hypothetical protein